VIYENGIQGSESDYIVHLSLNLLEACSLNDNVPYIIPRILLNNLYLQMKEKEINFTLEH
jgi:hypothetical protein